MDVGSSYMAVDPGLCCVSVEDGTVVETREGKTRIAAGERREVFLLDMFLKRCFCVNNGLKLPLVTNLHPSCPKDEG